MELSQFQIYLHFFFNSVFCDTHCAEPNQKKNKQNKTKQHECDTHWNLNSFLITGSRQLYFWTRILWYVNRNEKWFVYHEWFRLTFSTRNKKQWTWNFRWKNGIGNNHNLETISTIYRNWRNIFWITAFEIQL